MSYVVAMRRPINATEVNTADIGWLSFAGWMGAMLLAHDGIRDLTRLHALIRRVAVLGGFLAGLGIVQFVTGMALVDLIQIPGLVNNTVPLGVAERAGFNRPSGTAVHAIEFSVVVTMILPLALVNARIEDGRGTVRRWLPVVLMVAAVPIAISRSAIVGALIGLVVILPALPPSQRKLLVGGSAVAAVATFVSVPGLLGSVAGLFTGISADGSAQSRTNSYQLVWEYFTRHPFFGRGFSTFLPAHRILDNQYLGMLMDVGLVGLIAFLALILAGIGCAIAARRRSTVPRERELGQALFASISVGAVGFALFDGLSFPMTAGLLFLVIGLAGALNRLVVAEPAPVPGSAVEVSARTPG